MQTLLRTPLFDRHVALGARLVPFAGWEMPVQYEGVIPEHTAVRTDCGVFDVSHMGEVEVEGPRAQELLQLLLSNDLELAHVRHVEDAAVGSHGAMLGYDAVVLHRHLPARERHHPRTRRHVALEERRALKRLRHHGRC